MSGLLSFLSPEILLALGGLFATIIAFFAGGNRRKHKDRAERAEADYAAILKRKELDDELENLDPADRRKRLDKWVREAK